MGESKGFREKSKTVLRGFGGTSFASGINTSVIAGILPQIGSGSMLTSLDRGFSNCKVLQFQMSCSLHSVQSLSVLAKRSSSHCHDAKFVMLLGTRSLFQVSQYCVVLTNSTVSHSAGRGYRSKHAIISLSYFNMECLPDRIILNTSTRSRRVLFQRTAKIGVARVLSFCVSF